MTMAVTGQCMDRKRIWTPTVETNPNIQYDHGGGLATDGGVAKASLSTVNKGLLCLARDRMRTA